MYSLLMSHSPLPLLVYHACLHIKCVWCLHFFFCQRICLGAVVVISIWNHQDGSWEILCVCMCGVSLAPSQCLNIFCPIFENMAWDEASGVCVCVCVCVCVQSIAFAWSDCNTCISRSSYASVVMLSLCFSFARGGFGPASSLKCWRECISTYKEHAFEQSGGVPVSS